MFTKIISKILSSWRFIAFIFVSLVLISSSFLILVNQRMSVLNSSYLDELLILISAFLIVGISAIFIVFIHRTLIPINRRKVVSFRNRFSFYFIAIALTPAIIAGILGLVLVNFGINDWFNDKVKSVIKNSVNVAEGYVEEHNSSIKSDIYAMANDLNRNYKVFIRDRFKFEKYFEEQSIIRSLPETYIIDNRGNILMSKSYSIFTQFYKPGYEVIQRASTGELAIITSTTVNKVYALIRLPDFINAYLYVGRSLDPKVTKALDETKSVVAEYSNLENNRTQIAIVFMLIYILSILILIFISTLIGLRFAKKIVDPISNVINATDYIKKGSFDVSIPKSNEFIELNKLSESFNTMSSELLLQRNLLSNSEKHAAWSEIAKTIAHEIKNPLTPIQLSNDRIKKRLLTLNIDDRSLDECIDIITRQVNEIGNLVNEFSDFARMPKPIFLLNDLNTIVNNCVSAKSLICEGRIDIALINNDIIKMKCDNYQISQVLNNIIQNSINAIVENDVLNGRINININKKENKIMIMISDNGPGFIDKKAKLVEPYFTNRKKLGGTGLGLSIVNKIVTDHDGVLELSNNENKGAYAKILFNITNE